MTARPEIAAALPAVLEVLDSAQIGLVMLVHREGRFEKLHCNAQALARLGYSLEEWLALPMFDVFAPDQRSHFEQVYARLVDGGPLPPSLEISVQHRDGHPVRTEFAVARADIDGGHVLVMAVREMGHEQTQMSLLEADRISLVGALAAGFAHETNNPLTSVLLNLRSLRKQLVVAGLSDAKQSAALRCLDDINTGAERIASNVRAFQTLASRGQPQPIDLAVATSSVLRLAMPTLEPRAHVIRQISPVRAVAGEESRIGQAVLAMLLFSASGFDVGDADASNRIVVTVEEREDSIIVEVSDNGRDLAPEEAGHAFNPFFRSPVRGAGFGVGLGVARSVATTLGGDVVYVPRPGGGAVITMRLPPAPTPG